jgi:IS5 family transposase
VDRATKLITEFEISPAEVHDSLLLPLLVNEEDAGTEVFADRAYDSEQIRRYLAQMGAQERICRCRKPGRGFRWGEKERNGILSRIRCRVEQVFGTHRTSMHAGVIRTKGLVRTETVIALRNLAYNRCDADTCVTGRYRRLPDW